MEFGYKDIPTEEATNIRYRLKKDLHVKGWNMSKVIIDAAELSCMEEYLYNDDLGGRVL